jgi:hypothetical protein
MESMPVTESVSGGIGRTVLGRRSTDDESKSEELPVKKAALRRRLTANDGLLIGEHFLLCRKNQEPGFSVRVRIPGFYCIQIQID